MMCWVWKNVFQGTCFNHAFSKACQYATKDEKVCKGLKFLFVKVVQLDLQKCIILPKTLGKGRQEWNKACVNLGIPRKLYM